MYIAYDSNNVIRAVSAKSFKAHGQTVMYVPPDELTEKPLVGKKLTYASDNKSMDQLKVAMICNWNDKCGISTYSGFLVNELKNKVKEIRIYSEIGTNPSEDNVDYCWKRGQSMRATIEKILEWKPDFVVVQHEFGIFPNAFYYMQMLQMLENIPYAVVMHSVYEHLDKAVCTGVTKNIIVHSQAAKDLLIKMGNNNEISVIPHGCIQFDDVKELWNIFQNPYTIIQFGFGFFYKGMDRAIEAIHHLKTTDPKFANIFYCCLISTNDHNSAVNNNYYDFLMGKIKELGLEDNVTIHRKFYSDETLNNFLRTAKIAIFPYKVDPTNTVYGASGAVRIAMANHIPVIASESHLFDDLEGVIPRPTDHLELAREIDEIFSNDNYRNNIVNNTKKFVKDNSWSNVADMYLNVYTKVWHDLNKNAVCLK